MAHLAHDPRSCVGSSRLNRFGVKRINRALAVFGAEIKVEYRLNKRHECRREKERGNYDGSTTDYAVLRSHNHHGKLVNFT